MLLPSQMLYPGLHSGSEVEVSFRLRACQTLECHTYLRAGKEGPNAVQIALNYATFYESAGARALLFSEAARRYSFLAYRKSGNTSAQLASYGGKIKG